MLHDCKIVMLNCGQIFVFIGKFGIKRTFSFISSPEPSVHHFQISSSPKPLGESKPNFMWSLHGSAE